MFPEGMKTGPWLVYNEQDQQASRIVPDRYILTSSYPEAAKVFLLERKLRPGVFTPSCKVCKNIMKAFFSEFGNKMIDILGEELLSFVFV